MQFLQLQRSRTSPPVVGGVFLVGQRMVKVHSIDGMDLFAYIHRVTVPDKFTAVRQMATSDADRTAARMQQG